MGEVSQSVDDLLARLSSEASGEPNAAIARTLAATLDEARSAESAAALMAVAGIAKELRAVIDEIRSAADDREGFVTDLFS